MSTIILLKPTRGFHRKLSFNISLLFKNNRLSFSFCFLDRGEQSHDGEIPPFPPILWKNLSTCIFVSVNFSSYEPQMRLHAICQSCSVFNHILQFIDFPKRVENIGLFGSFIQHTKFSFQSDLDNNKITRKTSIHLIMACHGLMGSTLTKFKCI